MSDLPKSWYIVSTLKVVGILFAIGIIIYCLYIGGKEARTAAENRVEFVKQMFEGEHQLRKMAFSKTSQSEFSASGGYFIFAGGFSANSKTTEGIKVTFSWRLQDGSYGITTLPVEKIRVLPDSDKEVPAVRFQLKEFSDCYPPSQTPPSGPG